MNITEQLNYYLREDNNAQYLSVLNAYYQKTQGRNYPEPTESESAMKQVLIDIAKNDFNMPAKDNFDDEARAALMLVNRELPKIPQKKIEPKSETPKKEEPKEDENDSSKNVKPEDKKEEVPGDVPGPKWPSYSDFRKKWYKQTVNLGWPNIEFSGYKKEDGIYYPWNPLTRSAFSFSEKGAGLVPFRNYTKIIKDTLYKKYVKDIKGLKALKSKVDSILEVESQYLKKKNPGSIFGTLLTGIFKGLGASSLDESMLKWLTSKLSGMTVFEYQKYILDEMIAKMEISDDSATLLKNILTGVHTKIKSTAEKYYDLSTVDVKYDYHDSAYESFFRVKNKSGMKDEEHNLSYSVYRYLIKNFILPQVEGSKKFISSGSKPIDCNYTETEIKDLLTILNGESEKERKKIPGVLDVKDEIEFEYEQPDPKNPKQILGTFTLSFRYVNRGCIVTISFKSNKG